MILCKRQKIKNCHSEPAVSVRNCPRTLNEVPPTLTPSSPADAGEGASPRPACGESNMVRGVHTLVHLSVDSSLWKDCRPKNLLLFATESRFSPRIKSVAKGTQNDVNDKSRNYSLVIVQTTADFGVV